jgi:NAD(P) transhydrogenase subunit alpha
MVITTALIPGRPAPRLITRAMVESMAPGSIIVDLAAERGGNVELTVPGQVVEHNGVKIIGYTNMQGRIPTTASQLYARNLLAFVATLIDPKAKVLAIDWDDELVKATVLTRDGAVVHPQFAAAAAAVAPVVEAKGSAFAAAPVRKAPAKKVAVVQPVVVPAMADAPKKAAPGVQQSVPAAAEAVAPIAPKARPAAKKVTAVTDAAVAKPVAKKPAAPKKPATPAKDAQ